jgi:hypothetical protein
MEHEKEKILSTPENWEENKDIINFRMPWGKYHGSILCTLPSAYLFWLAENAKDDHIATMADIIWRSRENDGTHKGDPKYAKKYRR